MKLSEKSVVPIVTLTEGLRRWSRLLSVFAMAWCVCAYGPKYSMASTLVHDDFNDGVIDASLWSVSGASVVETGGVLTTTSRGTLLSVGQFTEPFVVKGEFTLNDGLEHFKVVIGTDGSTIGAGERTGILFAFANDGNQISIQRSDANGTNTILAVKDYSLESGVAYSFKASVSGSDLGLSVNGVPELSAVSGYRTGGNIGFYSREFGSTSSSIDWVRVCSIPEPSRAVIGLVGLMGAVVCHRRRRA